MEFVQNLEQSTDIPEIAVDGVGRVEIYKGRVRITLMRVACKNGVQMEEACISIVWTVPAWLEAQSAFTQARKIVTTNGPDALKSGMHGYAH